MLVINNRDRYFNGARKGQILEVKKEKVNYYLANGFSIFTGEKAEETGEKEEGKTAKELKEILDHAGVEYKKNATKAELQEMVNNLENLAKKVETISPETFKQVLIENAICTAEELEGKTAEELEQIAKDNGLI